MKLLAILEHGEAVAMLEAALIATFISHEACLNVAEGGESISDPSLCTPSFLVKAVWRTVFYNITCFCRWIYLDTRLHYCISQSLDVLGCPAKPGSQLP